MSRRLRLSDMDARGRLRLDAVARYLQDVATDDVAETGWGAPEHLWVVRRYVIDVVVPFLDDGEVELVTWGERRRRRRRGAADVAHRRSRRADRGRQRLDPPLSDGRAARLEDFGVYAESAAGRVVSTRKELPDPPPDAPRRSWRLRSTDVDVLGHVNNAIHWQAVEDALVRARRRPDEAAPRRARVPARTRPRRRARAGRVRRRRRSGARVLVGSTVKAVAQVAQEAG